MDISLDGEDAEEESDDIEESQNPNKDAKDFLRKNPTAKIVVVIDTHCLENGAFVWTGDSPTSYQACFLAEVRILTSLNPFATDIPADTQGLHSRRSISVPV